ncbi:hypothetical protein [Streptomyces kanasensis]|uniref:hypothetical protein n=1 Tax=Streptomyces kanasensis TaxID=936756 RepID=UPI0036FF1010
MTTPPRPSLAGRPAGVGRPKPGRPVKPSPTGPSAFPVASHAPGDGSRTKTATEPDRFADEEPELDVVPEGDSPAADAPRHTPSAAAREARAHAAETGVDRRIPVLTAGVGLSLMGLGIGFLGLRLRRR